MTLLRALMAWTGFMISLQICFRLAIATGLPADAWRATAHRLLGIVLGVGMVLFGNALPTLRSPWPYDDQPFAWQQVHRFVGWIFVLSGLAVIGSRLFLAEAAANRAVVVILGVTVVLTFERKFASIISLGRRTDNPMTSR